MSMSRIQMDRNMNDFYFDSWAGLWRIGAVGTLAYIALVLILRVSGKRTLTKLNAFDLVITVAIGSTLATILLNKDVALAEGVVAFAMLCFAQYLVTWTSIRSDFIRKLVKSEPALLLYQGELQRQTMRRERITEDEIKAAVRSARLYDLSTLEAVVLETDGSLSVLPRREGHPGFKATGMTSSELTAP